MSASLLHALDNDDFVQPSRIGLTQAEADAVHVADPATLHEGDSRADPASQGQPDLLVKIASLPEAIYDQSRDVRDMRNIVAEALQRELWANSADAANLAGTATTLGATAAQAGTNPAAWAPVFVNYTQGVGAQLKNIFVGASAAGVVQLVKSKDILQGTYFPDKVKILATVRLTSNALSAWAPGELLLGPGDNLYAVYLTGNTISLDFSCDYRQLRGE